MKTKVAILSAGLGHVSRGFEISTANWYNSLQEQKNLKVRLFSGGKFQESTKIWCISRDGIIASILRKLNLIKDGCRLEQLSFGITFSLYLIIYKPDVIWLQEGTLAQFLLRLRKYCSFNYKIIFCDGAPLGHKFANQFDHMVFLHEFGYDRAVKDGISKKKMSVIPYITKLPQLQSANSFRDKLNIAHDDFLIICVAAWNTHHKRIDYLLHEIAALPENKISLLLCGQPEAETAMLKQLAENLGIKAYWQTLSSQDLSKAYQASDLFILPSLKEGLGLVLIEAGLHGLPVISHPHDGGLSVLGEDYHGLTDLSQKGNLTKKIEYFRSIDYKEDGLKLKDKVESKFAPDKLVNKFNEMIIAVCRN